jgi:inorganic pyrophosphatase
MFDGVTVAEGEPGTPEFRLHFRNSFGKAISPWHDIRLQTAEYGTLNAVIEIPKMTTAKMEVATKEENNPIAQDMKKGKVRNYHGPIFWNYGLLPQTWEDPNIKDSELGCKGDNDPLDVVEIGSAALPMGSVVAVKPLGVLAMVDEGELDWKIIAISTTDPLADELHDLEHLEAKQPEVVSGIREWFRWYKTPDGKPLNSFGFEGRALPRAKANEVISMAFDRWRELRFGKAKNPGLWTQTVTSWTDGL